MIRPRADWGSRGIWGYVRQSDRKRTKVVVHHSVTNLAGKTPEQQVKEEEDIHYSLRNTKHYGSIAYNFVVSDDGQAWEGMSWENVTVANWWGDDTIAICVAGNYQPGVPNVATLEPNGAQLTAVADIIYEGVKLGWIAPNPEIMGHRQAGKTSCPGDNLFTKLDWVGVALYKILTERGNPDPNIIPPFATTATVLKLGSRGNAVKDLQNILNGFSKANLTVDGDFGPATVAAVKTYQTALKVTADGVWGPASQKAHEQFMAYLKAQTPAPSLTPPPAAQTPPPPPPAPPAPPAPAKTLDERVADLELAIGVLNRQVNALQSLHPGTESPIYT